MSVHIPPGVFQQSLDSIHLFAETSESSQKVITANLDLIDRWGWLKKLFFYFSLNSYLDQLRPQASTELFRNRLVTVVTSEKYTAHLAQTCVKACRVFNKLIVATDKELPKSRRCDLSMLLVDFQKIELQRAAPYVPSSGNGTGNGGALIAGPGNGMTIQEYDTLFTASKEGAAHSSASDSSSSSEEIDNDDHLFPDLPLVPSTSSVRHFTSRSGRQQTLSLDPRVHEMIARALRGDLPPELRRDMSAAAALCDTAPLTPTILPQPPIVILLTPTSERLSLSRHRVRAEQHERGWVRASPPRRRCEATVLTIDPQFLQSVLQYAQSLPPLLPPSHTTIAPEAPSEEPREAAPPAEAPSPTPPDPP